MDFLLKKLSHIFRQKPSLITLGTVGLFLIPLFLSHYEWFHFGTILQYGDWGYRTDTYAKSLFLDWGTWSGAFQSGSPNITLFSYPIRGIIWSLLANLGIGYPDLLRISIFIPVCILGFICPYIFVWNRTRSHAASLSLSLFYSSIPYFLVTQTAHLPISLVFSITPLFLFLIDKIFSSTKKNTWWAYLILLLFISASFELRITLISSFLFGIYIFAKFFSKENIPENPIFIILFSAGFSFLIFLLLQAYWILPTFNGLSDNINNIANRGLFGNHLFDLLHSFVVAKWSWTGGPIDWNFTLSNLPPLLFFMPILVFSGYFFLLKKFDRNPELLFFAIISLIGIFLTKQSSLPLPTTYQFLYENFPGFNLFREASKFHLVTSIGYLGILSMFLNSLNKTGNKNIFIATCALLIVISLGNLKPLITKEVDSLFVPRVLPEDYFTLNKVLAVEEDRIEHYRSLWIPRGSNFILNHYLRPKIDLVSINDFGLKAFFEESRLEKLNTRYESQIQYIIKRPFFKEILDSLSIKIIGVPIRDIENNDDFYISYGGKDNPNIREWYIEQLDALPYLKRIDIGTKELVVYENENYSPYLRAFPTLIGYNSFQNLDEKYTFSSSVLKEDFDFVEHREPFPFPTRGVRHIFENITPENISEHGITETFKAVPNTSLYARAPRESVSINDSSVSLSPAERSENFTRFPIETSADSITITYHDPEKSLSNRIPNPSFEEGLWKEKVGDCNHYDDNSLVRMNLSDEASDGSHSLELGATRHIACTNRKIPVSGGKTFLFSFDYQSLNGKQAGYHIGFDGPNKSSVSEKLPLKENADLGIRKNEERKAGDHEQAPWFSFSKQIKIPDGATTASFTVYSYSADEKTDIITRYDNFHLIELPDIENRYYLVSDPETNFVEPREIAFDLVNPTKKLVHIKGATTPFYLAMSESFHPDWQAQFNNGKINGFFRSWVPWVKPDAISNDHHFELNGFLNGWYVDINEHCVEKKLCTQNSDGSYDMELTIEFFPQRWFYLGLLISGTTFIGCLWYLSYDYVPRRLRRDPANVSTKQHDA